MMNMVTLTVHVQRTRQGQLLRNKTLPAQELARTQEFLLPPYKSPTKSGFQREARRSR
eukprot:SAG22_NODE_113_length_19407_cov_214.925161_7_plen_58_part_00